MGVQGNDTQTQLSRHLLLSCRVGLHLCPVWARSTHAHKLNPALHDCCRIISGCLKPTNLVSLPHGTHTTNDRRQTPTFPSSTSASRLKSRKSFMRTVTPLDSSASSRLWKDSLTDMPASVYSKWDWMWPSLCRLDLERTGSVGEPLINRLRTGVGRAKTVMRRWGYLDDALSVECDCGEPQTMAHLLSCRLLDEACTADDLATVTERAMACARKWEKVV